MDLLQLESMYWINILIFLKEKKMKKILLGILAITLVFGMTIVGCADSGGGGEFTLTNIPPQYEGLYAGIEASYLLNISGSLVGASSINLKKQTISFPRIKNGKVSIPMFVKKMAYKNGTWEDTIEHYEGNDVVSRIGVVFFNTNNPSDYQGEGLLFTNVQFLKGSAAKTWSEGTLQAIH